ncbi:MAG: hypothetical protein PCFJNLEI_00379 [Verrucomicrobiae bacterium]|nr:hypothetical protein [Verrucomicrobiae bacterium]
MTPPTSFKLKTLVPAVKAELFTDASECEITGCYISDLLSDVLAHAKPGVLWATVQTHRNVISVACTKDIPAVLFVCGRKPEAEVIKEAEEAGVILLGTPLTAFAAAGRLWESGLHE